MEKHFFLLFTQTIHIERTFRYTSQITISFVVKHFCNIESLSKHCLYFTNVYNCSPSWLCFQISFHKLKNLDMLS